MKLAEIIGALGGGAVVGWISKAFMAREKRLTVEAETKSRIADSTGETDVTAIRAMEAAMARFADMSKADRDKLFVQQMAHMECLARCERLQTRLDALEEEHAGCPARIVHLETQLSTLTSALINAGLLPALEETAE